ncbi:MAG: GNAT family N-acetyltransferase [Rhizomicrobium sp.]|jgi:ribosomal protein S18 acetylase RimI-like enzyme
MEDLDAVRETEEHLMNAWPSLRTLVCNGWVFRQADGYTKRANSANAMAVRGPFAPTLESARKFYSSFGCPTIFRLTPLAGPEPDRILADLGFHEVDETLVMRAAISTEMALETNLAIAAACTEEWEAGYAEAHAQDPEQRRQHRAILKSIAPLPTAFATIRGDGRPTAFGLGVVERGRLGLFDIVTSPTERRKGSARKLVGGLLHWGRSQGAETAWLSVIHANINAIALYRQLGFTESYRYHYRVAP